MAEFPTKRIINLGEQSEPQSGDYIVTDNQASGTKKTPASALAKAADLAAEQTARQQADEAEAQARTEAISDEQTTREEADDALSDSITALSGEVTAQGALIQNPTKTVSGEVAHFTDGAEMPAKSVVVNIEPQQSGTGTPSPDNVRAISGWESVSVFDTGVNVWDEEWESGGLSTAGAETVDSTKIRNKGFIAVKPNATYYGIAPSTLAIRFYDASKTFVGTANGTNREFTAPSNAYYLRFFITATTYNHDISINYPSTDHEYHAYNPNSSTKTVNLGRTVYGGTLDVVSGVLTDKMGMVDLGTLNWSYIAQDTNAKGFYAFLPQLKTGYVETGNVPFICSKYETGGIQWARISDGQIGTNTSVAGSTTQIIIKDSSYTDALEFKSSLNGTQLVYPLATPQTYQLTPTQINTLLGENNVWADAGAVDVTYRRDINLALEQLEALLNGTETATAQPTASTAETSEA